MTFIDLNLIIVKTLPYLTILGCRKKTGPQENILTKTNKIKNPENKTINPVNDVVRSNSLFIRFVLQVH